MGSVFFPPENLKYFSFSSPSLFGSHLISISRTQLSDYSYLHAKIDYNLLSLITFFSGCHATVGRFY